ncbi:MATE family efflux transporter [Oceanirhabdus sp. W0125-5]|uniref:MATE family efflux transporter n=1 Tax=Oceanirhabdus sp. W0125-5 TaxID=2999116 RepID=UPI0022F34732|nr:MATE family efflux transporter [Oceanirhabdus sp. W0125-5]WBW98412.1 MATE family efflux transporter [Oceanirhabdus sp. W0125-5]
MGTNSRRELILKGNLKKAIILIALPVMLSNLIQTLYNLIDTFWVSKLGGTDLAAMSFVWPLSFLMIAIGIGFSVAGASLISQYVGAKNYEKAKNIIGNLLIISAVISIVLGTVGYFVAPIILKLKFFNLSNEVYIRALGYIQIIFMGLPTMFFMFVFNSIKQGEGDTVSPMKFGAISVGLNIILDPIFIFVFNMGIEGAAWATVISRGIIACISIASLFFCKGPLRLDRKYIKKDKEIILKIVKVGLPSSFGQSMSALGFMVLNGFIISFGENIMSAFAVGNRINSLVLMPAMGIGSSLAAIVGQNLGADNIKRAKKAIWESVKICTIFMVVGGIIVTIFSNDVVRIFADRPDIIEPGTYYLKLICMSLPLVGYFQILIGTFQGSGHTLSAMVLMMGRLWALRIPMIMLLTRFESLGEKAIWFSMVGSNFFICLIGLGIFMTGNWQKKIIKGEPKNKEQLKSDKIEKVETA